VTSIQGHSFLKEGGERGNAGGVGRLHLSFFQRKKRHLPFSPPPLNSFLSEKEKEEKRCVELFFLPLSPPFPALGERGRKEEGRERGGKAKTADRRR